MKDVKKRILALENNRYRMLLQMYYIAHTPCMESYSAYWKYDTSLEIITKRRIIWFGRVVRAKSTMASTILLSKDEGKNDEEGQPLDDGWKGMDRLSLT